MSRDYALSRVKDALEKSGGNHLKAQRLLISWLEKDHSLLFGLVSPHMHSIITHALVHVDEKAQKKPMPKRINPKEHETSEFGSALLDSLRGKGGEEGVFGQSTPRNIPRPGATSKTHVDAINKIVASGRSKEKKAKK
jgi:hypothetical protein